MKRAESHHEACLDDWRHPHTFGQELRRPGEGRTRLVIALTAVTMVVEIAAGLAFGSMALLADGLHMASHAAALAITAFAYAYARRHAHDARFSLGTGKVNALGGYTGAVLLAVFAAFMAFESVKRFLAPVPILFDQALMVAFVGLLVNALSAWILGRGPKDADPDGAASHVADHGHHHHGHHDPHHHDHNLRSAYLHVVADAVTSVAAIVALLAGKLYGLSWMDPAMGIVGALLIARWSWGLLRQASHVLLDHQAPEELVDRVRRALEADSEDRVADLHVWSIGPGIWAASTAVVTDAPRPAEDYKARLPEALGLVHVTVEVNPCRNHGAR